MTISYLSFGSNLGDKEKHISSAMEDLAKIPSIRLLRISNIYETEPVDMPDGTPAFLNGALEIDTACTAQELLHILKEIEIAHGRVHSNTSGYESRTLDLDIILFGNEIINEPGLIIPHTNMLKRWFVLQPLHDLCPELAIPGTTVTITTALQEWKEKNPAHSNAKVGLLPLPSQ